MATKEDNLTDDIDRLVDLDYVVEARDARTDTNGVRYRLTARGDAAKRAVMTELHKRVTDSE